MPALDNIRFAFCILATTSKFSRYP